MNRTVLVIVGMVLCCGRTEAQTRIFVGALSGVSTLSADGASIIEESTASVSLYSPQNGPALNIVGGVHLSDFLSVQGNYVWNQNRLTLTSTRFSDGSQTLYQQQRRSVQHGVIGDLLLYFRNRQSWLRPYLSAGVGLVYFASTEDELLAVRGSPTLPPKKITSSEPALRVAVGIDLSLSRGWAFRYSFSETLRRNPISGQLSPPGQRNLANFQNLFGLVKTF